MGCCGFKMVYFGRGALDLQCARTDLPRKKSPTAIMKTLEKIAYSIALLCLSACSAKAATLTNWARAGTATQSTTYNAQADASRAIDGNTAGSWGESSTTHTADSENTADGHPWWQVDLKGPQPIGHVHLWFREDCCFARNDNLRIVIFDKPDTTSRVVLWETNNQAWPAGMVPRDIGFDIKPTISGGVVYVEHLPDQTSDNFVCLTEVEVFNQALAPETNYALQSNGGSATSSSVYSGDPTLYGPQQANDGNHLGWSATSPWGYSAPDDTAGVDPLPWWQVDLQSPQTVGSIVLWPRRDATNARFQNLRLTVADASSKVLYQQLLAVQPSGPKFVVNLVPPVANAKSVRVETTASTPDPFLNLPEVEVFGPLASAPTITFATNLAPVSVQQNRPVTLGPVGVVVDGGIRPEDISYRWYRNGAEIPNAAGSWLNSYTLSNLAALSNSGDLYKVQASVSGQGVFSPEVALTVTNDVTPPTIVSNQVQVTDQIRVNLVFSEVVDPTTATNLSNYTLSGGPTVGSLTLGADGETVTLVVQNVLLGDNVALTVSGVKDLAGNAIASANISAAIPQTPINYARGGTATQNSIYNNTPASRAIDGSTAGNWGANSIACTANGDLGWWEVDLKSAKTIGSVDVWWRTDCCGTRNEHVDLVIYDTADPNTRQEVRRVPLTGAAVPPNPTVLSLGNGQLGQVVRLEHTAETDTTDANNVQMCLAEVQVFPPPSGLVVTPAPSSWNVYAGDRIFLRSGSTGQTPIATQWQHNGVNIPGATSPELVLTNITPDQAGTYVFMASNAVRVRYSQPATVVVSPRPALAYNLVARYLFNADGGTNALDDAPLGPAKTVSHDGRNSATWVASQTDAKNVTRTGVLQFDGTVPNQIAIQPQADLNSPAGTIAFWINTAPPEAGKTILFDRRGGTNNWGDVLVLHLNSADSPNGIPDTIFDQAYPSGVNVGGLTPVDDGNWHHIAYVYTWKPFGIVSFYIDGKLDSELTHGDPGAWPLDQELEFGQSHDSYWPPYTGYLDDIHIFNRTLSAAEITQLMTGGVPAAPPTLAISRAGSNLTISWTGTGYVLQQNANLANSTAWANVPGVTASPATVSLPTSGSNFYRLKQQ
jgi:hypothetical protein